MNLYEISHEVERIADIIDRTNLDDALMTPEDREAMQMFVDGLKTEAETKVDMYAKAIAERERRAEMRRAEARRLSELAASDETSSESMRRFLLACMQRMNTKMLQGSLFTLAVQANGGKRPIDIFVEVDKIPDRFTRINREPDKDAIRDALLADDKEAMKIATLMERGVSLRIK